MTILKKKCCCHIDDCDAVCAQCPDTVNVLITNIVKNPEYDDSDVCTADISGILRRHDGLGCRYQIAPTSPIWGQGCPTMVSSCAADPTCSGSFTYYYCTSLIGAGDPFDCGDCFQDISLNDPDCISSGDCAPGHFRVVTPNAGFYIRRFTLTCKSIEGGDAYDGWELDVDFRNVCESGDLLCAQIINLPIAHLGCPAGISVDYDGFGISTCLESCTIITS